MKLVVIIFAVWFVYIIYKWLIASSEYDHRPVPSVSLFLCIVPLIISVYVEYQHYQREQYFADISEKLIGIRPKVECETFGQSFLPKNLFAEGYAGDGRIFLRAYVCKNLNKFIENPDPNSLYHTTALAIFVHESMHIKGTIDEAETECYAMQHMAQAAILFGVEKHVAQQAAKFYFSNQYMGRRNSNDPYYTPNCRPDGPLDLHLPLPPWAT